MKTFRLVGVIALICIAVSLVSCSGDDDTIDLKNPPKLAGTAWTCTNWYEYDDLRYTISFKSDGSYTWRVQNYETGTGYYTYIYPCISLSTGGEYEVYTFTSFKGSSFVLESTSGKRYTFKKYNGEESKSDVKDVSGTVQGHDYVDLGLSVKWATCNVGAYSLYKEGDYYAWAETREKSWYSWDNYKWFKQEGEDGATYKGLSKYCDFMIYGYFYYDEDLDDEVGYEDNLKTIQPEDDVASSKWGNKWRIPTKAEMEELITKCTFTSSCQNGYNGVTVQGPSGKSIFLPFCWDWPNEKSLGTLRGFLGEYWSSSLRDEDPEKAFLLQIDAIGDEVGADIQYRERCGGYLIRPVTK